MEIRYDLFCHKSFYIKKKLHNLVDKKHDFLLKNNKINEIVFLSRVKNILNIVKNNKGLRKLPGNSHKITVEKDIANVIKVNNHIYPEEHIYYQYEEGGHFFSLGINDDVRIICLVSGQKLILLFIDFHHFLNTVENLHKPESIHDQAWELDKDEGKRFGLD